MKQTLILLAGYPGTGKSYFANTIMDKFPMFKLCSPDEIKEAYWDKYGFNSLVEKEALIQKSWNAYYRLLKNQMQAGYSVICDYPFSDKQKATLQKIAKKQAVQIMTIRLVGDIKILFERQKQRDLHNARHLGHILVSYHKGITVVREQADNLLDDQEFYRRCTTRGYGTFSLGKTIEVDVSDFTKVDYSHLLGIIGNYIN